MTKGRKGGNWKEKERMNTGTTGLRKKEHGTQRRSQRRK